MNDYKIKVKAALKNLKKTQGEVAQEININQFDFSRYMNGRYLLDTEQESRLLEALNGSGIRRSDL